MKRTLQRERISERRGNDTTRSIGSRGRAFLAAGVVVILGASIVAAPGCRSLFVRDMQGRYLDGRDATHDWERAWSRDCEELANGESFSQTTPEKSSYTTRGAAPYPYVERYTVRGGISEVSSADTLPELPEKKSWSEKMTDAFKFPTSLFSSKTKREEELEEELTVAGGNRRQTEQASSRRQYSESANRASSSEGRQESTSFWSKIFPPQKQESSEDSDLITRRSYSGTPRETSSNQRSSAASPVGKFARTADIFGKRRSNAKPWNRPGLAVEQYTQTRFLPPMKTIEKYYSVDSVAPARRHDAYAGSYAYGDAATREVETLESRRASAMQTPEPSRVEKTAAVPKSVYQSNSYAPVRTEPAVESTDQLPAAPESPRGGYLDRRRGDVSLSPIPEHASESSGTGVRQTSANVRSNSRGTTRPAESTVSNASFIDRRAIMSQSSDALSSESYGDAAEYADEVVAGPADVDDAFRRSLGRQRSYEWFSSDDSLQPEALPRPSLAERFPERNGLSVDDYADEIIEAGESDPAAYDAGYDYDSASADAEVEDGLAAADDDFISNSPFANSAAPEFSNETVWNDSNSAVEGGDLDSIVDGAIAKSALANIPTSEIHESDVFSKSTVSGGSVASDLANAIMESVTTDEALVTKATALSEAAPESVDARKSEEAPAPLTQEEIAWIEQIKNAIKSLLAEREEHKRRGDDVRICDARLRLLYLVIGQYERSIHEIQDESDPLRNFWEKECRGLETLLQNQLEEIDPTFVAERLRSGLDSLSSFCQLRIRKMLLVEAPACYGLFEERYDAYESGEALYAYSELDYVTSRDSGEGFAIDVECRWRFLHSDGTPITPFESQRCSNVSETKLRDVVLNVSAPLPEGLEPGVYLLELEVSDLNASKPNPCVQRLTVRVGKTESNEVL